MTRWSAILVVVLLTGCPSATPVENARDASKTDRLDVLATTAMVGDVVSAVGRSHVDVTVLLGPGVDPHLHKTTRDDVARIMKADVVFYSGLMLEGKMTDTLSQIAKTKPVRAITDAIDPAQLLGDDQHADPHVWFDATLWASTADLVAQVLGESMPQHAAEFQAAAAEYSQTLQTLDQYGRRVIASIPDSNRIVITSHDAFGYMGRAYGIEVLGVQGISTDSEAGLRRVNDLVDLIVEKRVPAVFIETSVRPKSIRALIDGAASRGHTVTIGGELFSDAAGPAGTYEGTYVGMLDHNFTLIARALGGDAPADGMNGQLNAQTEGGK